MLKMFLNKTKMRGLLTPISLMLLGACSSASITEPTNNAVTALQTRAEWRALLKWPQSCDDGVSHIAAESFIGVDLYPWTLGRKLVSVMCETGVYTWGEMYFLETGEATGKFNLLVFPQFKAIADAPQELNFTNKGQAQYYQYSRALLWGNLRVDSSNGNISNDGFYRGGGGCGVSTTYSLFNNKPVILSLKTQQCEDQDIPIAKWAIRPQSEYSTWPVLK